MRIGSHYRPPAYRLLPAFLALVYISALSGGLVLHMGEEGEKLHATVLATAESGSGEPTPLGDDLPDDLDCLLCQVLAGPSHPGAAPSALVPGSSGEAVSSPLGAPTPLRPTLTGQARAPPFA